jgi:hypothetical protein
MEETQYRLNLLRDNMDYYFVTTPADGLSKQQLDLFYAEQQLIWADASRRWVQFRMPLARVHCLGPAKAGKPAAEAAPAQVSPTSRTSCRARR